MSDPVKSCPHGCGRSDFDSFRSFLEHLPCSNAVVKQDVADALEFTRMYIGHASKHLNVLAKECREAWARERDLERRLTQ